MGASWCFVEQMDLVCFGGGSEGREVGVGPQIVLMDEGAETSHSTTAKSGVYTGDRMNFAYSRR